METTTVNVVHIVNGNFAKSENNKGNFSGFDIKGKRWFISKDKVNALGIEKNEDFEPFWIIGVTSEYRELGEDGKPKVNSDNEEIKFTRTEAGAVFKTREEAKDARLSTTFFDLECAKDVQDKIDELELSSTLVDKLVTNL